MGYRFLTVLALIGLAACKNEAPERTVAVSTQQQVPVSMQGVQAKQLFGAKPVASQQSSAPFGGYSKGCLFST